MLYLNETEKYKSKNGELEKSVYLVQLIFNFFKITFYSPFDSYQHMYDTSHDKNIAMSKTTYVG